MNNYLIIGVVWAVSLASTNLYTYIKTSEAESNKCIATGMNTIIKVQPTAQVINKQIATENQKVITKIKYINNYIKVPVGCDDYAESLSQYRNSLLGE